MQPTFCDITYSLHPETSAPVHHIEEVFVLLAPEKVEARNLKITPKVAHVVRLAFHGLRVDFRKRTFSRFIPPDFLGQLLLLLFLRFLFLGRGVEEHLPEPLGLELVLVLVGGRVTEYVGHGLSEFLQRDGESIRLVELGHFQERIIGDVTKVLDLRLQAPVPFVLEKKGMLVEESGQRSAGSPQEIVPNTHPE